MKVKICGIKSLSDAKSAVSQGADFIGFVFYKKSVRFISPEDAKAIIRKLPAKVKTVGVFVNERAQMVNHIIRYCGLKYVQLHGDETPGFLKKIKGAGIIKALRVNGKPDVALLKKFDAYMLLFDAYSKHLYGGTGKKFDWGKLSDIKLKKPFFVSGGLNAKNVSRMLKKLKPFCVDVSSGVETSPGIKDHKLIGEFIKKVKTIN